MKFSFNIFILMLLNKVMNKYEQMSDSHCTCNCTVCFRMASL